jgi:hypothetical protein
MPLPRSELGRLTCSASSLQILDSIYSIGQVVGISTSIALLYPTSNPF